MFLAFLFPTYGYMHSVCFFLSYQGVAAKMRSKRERVGCQRHTASPHIQMSLLVTLHICIWTLTSPCDFLLFSLSLALQDPHSPTTVPGSCKVLSAFPATEPVCFIHAKDHTDRQRQQSGGISIHSSGAMPENRTHERKIPGFLDNLLGRYATCSLIIIPIFVVFKFQFYQHQVFLKHHSKSPVESLRRCILSSVAD